MSTFPPAWMDRAACQGTDPEMFFPAGYSGPSAAQVDEAKAICARCPVTGPCFGYAVATQAMGIWGGMTEEERRQERRRRIRRAA